MKMRLRFRSQLCLLLIASFSNAFTIHSLQPCKPSPLSNPWGRSTALPVSVDEASLNGVVEVSEPDAALIDEEKPSHQEKPYELVLPVYECDVPIGQYKVETTHDGPSGGPVHTLTVNMGRGEEPLVFVSGKIGRQASGALTLTRGDTVLYTTCSRDKDPKDDIDFLPLSVEHQERFSSIGSTSGSYSKRDGRPAEHEILTCRLIDRPIRPLIAEGWRHETQLLNWVLSFDGKKSCDTLSMTNAAAALYISDVPIKKPVAAVTVGYINDQFVMNPNLDQMEHSKLSLTVAGTMDGVLMIEGAADFLPESVMVEAVSFGHECIKELCVALEAFANVAGKEKKYDTIIAPPENLQARVDELFTERVDAMWNLKTTKVLSGNVMGGLYDALNDELGLEYPEDVAAVKKAFKHLLSRRMFIKAKNEGTRCDGRGLDEIRRISMETSILPRVHGSALFTRGETQCIATATLGDSGMKQRIERVEGNEEKRFYLQYTFPPSCVGETGRVGMPGRREVGHGNLAERALQPSLPSEEDFPYSIRVESLITESHGSSSMASVCGGTLALMDAGVPIKSPVAGIAMGLLIGDNVGVSDEEAVILSDILGTEDALGTMDFKVAGNRNGITTFQLDIKCEGLSLETLERALDQARVGRLYLLDEMEKVLAAPRRELPPTVPKMRLFSVPYESIGKIIGPGGKQIRAIIEDFKLSNMDVKDDGSIQITGMDLDQLVKAQEFVSNLIKGNDRAGGGRGAKKDIGKPKYEGPMPEVGQTYTGKITGLHSYGVFLEILPGAEDGSYPGLEGLCHVSELHTERVRNCEGFVRSLGTEELTVRFLGINEKGQLRLSRKEVLENPDGMKPLATGTQPEKPQAPTTMTDDEVDIIAKAIERLSS